MLAFAFKFYKFLNRNYRVAILVVLLGFFLPYYLQFENSYFYNFDVLDAHAPFYKILKDRGIMFTISNNVRVSGIMNNELPRNALPPGFNFVGILFYIFPSFTAFLINFTISHLVAFWGMFFFLRKYILKEKIEGLLLVIISGFFMYLPFFEIFEGVNNSGIPFVAYAFLNIIKNEKPFRNYVILGAFAFYSSLILIGIFVIAYMVLITTFDFWKKKSINKNALIAIFMIIGIYLLENIQLINLTFFSGIVSHRSEITCPDFTTKYNFEWLIHSLSIGEILAQAYGKIILIFASISIILVVFTKKINSFKPIFLILSLILFNSLVNSFWCNEYINPIKEQIVLFKMVNFARVVHLNPFLWYVLLAFLLKFWTDFSKYNSLKKVLIFAVPSVLIPQFYMIIGGNMEYRQNIYQITKVKLFESRFEQNCSYREFYSTTFFEEIGNFIGKTKQEYQIACIGIPPNILAYNGFQTVDFDSPNYPLSYKKKFRPLIEKEIEKSKKYQWTYDSWGNKCYVLSAELDKHPDLILKYSNLKISNLQLNTKMYDVLHIDYIFSAVEILNAKENKLSLEKHFEKNEVPYEIFLYKTVL